MFPAPYSLAQKPDPGLKSNDKMLVTYIFPMTFFAWAETKLGKRGVWDSVRAAFGGKPLDEAIAVPLGGKTMGDLMPEFRSWALAHAKH